jgi:Uma2 family endonuclease
MPTVLTEAPVEAALPGPPRKKWTRQECLALEATGLFDQQHLELIEGELIDKMGKKRPHVNSLVLLHNWLVAVFGGRFVIQEGPIDVAAEDNPTNEPEPDLVVLKRDISNFTESNPTPAGLHLVVEIADTTLAFDRKTKAPLYARAGISEYWVLDVNRRQLLVHHEPTRGVYASVQVYNEGESVSPLAAPQREFPVVDAFLAWSG